MPGKRPIEPGRQFGRWTVIDPERHIGPEGQKRRARAAECRCECGTVKVVKLGTLTRGASQSCGCFAREQARIRSQEPETYEAMLKAANKPSEEQRALGAARFRSPEHRAIVAAASRTHGLSRHPLYDTWKRMRRRCEVPGHKDYANYGGRGIRVCAEWRDVTAFITWIEANIGLKPPGTSLDRIEADGDYEPGNVRWATFAEQSANRRKAVWLGLNHWQVVLVALNESSSPQAAATHAALSAQLEYVAPRRADAAGREPAA